MNIRESIGTGRAVSNDGIWEPGAQDLIDRAQDSSKTRPTGIIVSDHGQEIGVFLSEYYDVHCYTQHDVERAGLHFDATEQQFMILGWASREPTLEALAWIRGRSNLPAIVTGPASEPECVAALEGGAADYVVVSTGNRELLVRIHAVLRYYQPLAKKQTSAKRKGAAEGHIYEFGQWRYDARKRRLMDPQGLNVALTRSEYSLLKVFLEAPKRVLTREYLLRATRMTEDILDRSIDVRILRLRRKLSAVVPAESIISTERGVGYRFAMQVTRSSDPADLK
jgi:two-component system, OmpR family, response regulator